MIKKKKVSIIGSTGQIGKQTINIIKNSKNFKVSLISCEKDIETLLLLSIEVALLLL